MAQLLRGEPLLVPPATTVALCADGGTSLTAARASLHHTHGALRVRAATTGAAALVGAEADEGGAHHAETGGVLREAEGGLAAASYAALASGHVQAFSFAGRRAEKLSGCPV